MSEEVWQAILIAGTLVGFGLTAGGLIAAVFSAFKEVESSKVRIWKSIRLAAEEQREGERLRAENPATTLAESNAAFMRRYAAEGLIRPSYANVVYIPAREARRLIKLTLQSALVNLIVAGVGLVVSTATAVVGLIVL